MKVSFPILMYFLKSKMWRHNKKLNQVLFSPVKKRKKTNSLEKEYEIICFMFRNNLFHKKMVEESKVPSLLEKGKHWSAKCDVSKVLLRDIGKITNLIA